MLVQRCLRMLCVVVVGGLILQGCGGSTDAPTLYRVSGTVTYNGQAVPGAKVMFLGDGKSAPAVGVTNSNGKYTLSSLSGTGAVAGKHVVTVLKETEADPAASINMSMEDAAKAAQKPVKADAQTSLIPAKYSNPQTSGLEFEVKSGSNDFPIELKN